MDLPIHPHPCSCRYLVAGPRLVLTLSCDLNSFFSHHCRCSFSVSKQIRYSDTSQRVYFEHTDGTTGGCAQLSQVLDFRQEKNGTVKVKELGNKTTMQHEEDSSTEEADEARTAVQHRAGGYTGYSAVCLRRQHSVQSAAFFLNTAHFTLYLAVRPRVASETCKMCLIQMLEAPGRDSAL